MLSTNWNGITLLVTLVCEADYVVLQQKRDDRLPREKQKKVALELSEKQADETISQTIRTIAT